MWNIYRNINVGVLFATCLLVLILKCQVSATGRNVFRKYTSLQKKQRYFNNEETRPERLSRNAKIHNELVNLIEESASTTEAAHALHNHASLNFLANRLVKHADLSLEQILIDLHHTQKTRIYKSKSIGECEPANFKYYLSCAGKNKNCRSSDESPCKGLCRCNTVGIDECECVKSLKEPMVEDNTNAFVKIIHRASDDMIETGKTLITEIDEIIEFSTKKIKQLASSSIHFIRKAVKRKVRTALEKISTTKADVENQQKKVQAIRLQYKGLGNNRAAQTRAFKQLAHEIGVLNGMEQILSIKNILKMIKGFFEGAKNMLLPDLLVLGTSYTSTAAHVGGIETILDFRTREIGQFKYGGYNVGTNQLRLELTGSAYIGVGWQHALWCKHLSEKYSGLFRTVDASTSIPGVTSLPGFASISFGGAIGVSAGGLGVFSKCCPLMDYIKTLSFSVSASLGFGLPTSANVGCTDYEFKKELSVCSTDLHAFIKDIFIVHPALFISPLNALLTFGLAFGNDHRAVSGGNFCQAPSEKVCPCKGLPKVIGSCGNREHHGCDALGASRLVKQETYSKHAKAWTQKTIKIIKQYGFTSIEFFTHVFGHDDNSICHRQPLLKQGDFHQDVKALRVMLAIDTVKHGKHTYFDENVAALVRQFNTENNLSGESGETLSQTTRAFWNNICKEETRYQNVVSARI
eukprot:g5474.t1